MSVQKININCFKLELECYLSQSLKIEKKKKSRQRVRNLHTKNIKSN